MSTAYDLWLQAPYADDDDSRVLAMRAEIAADKERVHDLLREALADGDDPLDMLVWLQVLLADAYRALRDIDTPPCLIPLQRAAKSAYEDREQAIEDEVTFAYHMRSAA